MSLVFSFDRTVGLLYTAYELREHQWDTEDDEQSDHQYDESGTDLSGGKWTLGGRAAKRRFTRWRRRFRGLVVGSVVAVVGHIGASLASHFGVSECREFY